MVTNLELDSTDLGRRILRILIEREFRILQMLSTSQRNSKCLGAVQKVGILKIANVKGTFGKSIFVERRSTFFFFFFIPQWNYLFVNYREKCKSNILVPNLHANFHQFFLSLDEFLRLTTLKWRNPSSNVKSNFQ